MNHNDVTRNDKPQATKLGWQILQTSYPFQNEMTRLRHDRVRVEGDDEMEYAYAERADAVIMVPITPQGEMVLLKQYRYPVDEWCLEVPAGGSHDTGDADLEEVACKELHEEIGATCEVLEYIGFFYSNNSLSNEKCHVYLALDVKLREEPHQEETENIEMQIVPVREALELVRSGQMKTGPSALAVLLCENELRRRGIT